jgi:hypothetical protein
MCLTLSPLVDLRRWNWDGGRIVHDCIVPSSRPVVGRSGPRSQYDIDVREFLVTVHNEIMRRTLLEDVPRFAKLHGLAPESLAARSEGSFDRRAAVIGAYVAAAIRYRTSAGRDAWQFPDETLHLKVGDCEDRALLLASLLLASGISTFNVRVGLGRLLTRDAAGRAERHDHVWTMYKTEAGRWTVLEPHFQHALGGGRTRARRAGSPVSAEYVPYFLFNDTHLWEVDHPEERRNFRDVVLARAWRRINPKFAGEIHKSIVSEALAGIPECPAWLSEGMMRHFSSYFGAVVDAPDNFVASGYDCLDHFDNAFIDEGWRRVDERLARFRANPQGGIEAITWAAHGIADFYAHSSYGEFGPREEGKLLPYEATPAELQYRTGPYDLSRFSVNAGSKGDPGQRAAAWEGKLISGRYCQPGDSRSFLERICPTPGYLKNPGGRRLLPHHDEIAVDGPEPHEGHVLYKGDPARYAQQFELRRGAAVAHIQKAVREGLGLAG